MGILRGFLFLYCLPEEMDTVTVHPLWSLNTELTRWHPRIPDAAVVCSDLCICHPTLYVAARSRVGLLPLCCDAAVYAFKRSLRLHIEEAIHRYDEWG